MKVHFFWSCWAMSLRYWLWACRCFLCCFTEPHEMGMGKGHLIHSIFIFMLGNWSSFYFYVLFLKRISMNRMKSKVMYLDAFLHIEFPCRFLSQTGLVSVEHQMQEMGLAPKDSISKKDTWKALTCFKGWLSKSTFYNNLNKNTGTICDAFPEGEEKKRRIQ